MPRALFYVFVILISILSCIGRAEDVQAPKLIVNDSYLEKINQFERKISGGVQTLSSDIDSFFSRDEREIENTGSRLRLGSLANFQEYEDPGYDSILAFKLVLPKTKDKLQFILFNDEEDDLASAPVAGGSSVDKTLGESVKSQKYNVGLRGFFHKSKTSAVLMDSGVKLHSALDPFVRFTARRSFFFSENELRFMGRVYWFESMGWASTLSTDLDRPISATWLFRFANSGEVDHESGLWDLDHFLALYNRRSERIAIGYILGVNSDQKPVLPSGAILEETHANSALALRSYYATVNFRYALIAPWLFFEVAPRYTWPREIDWHHVASIQFKIEGIFGI